MAIRKTEYESIKYYMLFDNPPAWFADSPKAWREEISNVIRDTKEFFYIVKYENDKIVDLIVDLLNNYMED